MSLVRSFPIVCLAFLLTAPLSSAKGPSYTDPKKADADFGFQGEYLGEHTQDGQKRKIGVQVIALGKGQFKAKVYVGGLPGQGWKKGDEMFEADGVSRDGGVDLKNENGRGRIEKGVLTVYHGDQEVARLKKVMRKSPTLGQKPPAGAVVLFNGKDASQWKGGKVVDGMLKEGTTSKPTFGSHRLHIEFRLPYEPQNRGQGRGNSGVYLQGRYEVQMLDSFGLAGKHNECGGIYSIREPDVNMCLPPLSWQTYDIEFHAAEYDKDGKVRAHPRMTVYHNGVRIHHQVELKRSTTAAPVKPGPNPGPVYLQNHGNPVRYRNIWVMPIKAGGSETPDKAAR